ncbi:metal ABC transporter ATP-binding protein [Arthrobacter gandavensis]|uniref:zinc ABC transporter ATP-binding protein AztA n=1 Tax=Arthrobacter gandavensis TaxID=169960 RepID=UPI00189009DA|nr:zinc ABC transporter ATP-binding protein AztA [Arthrobacter gandavensis]MBF4992737.1 metal ABC transporter ATP-binding protein [Arthrobacter gandavensis]
MPAQPALRARSLCFAYTASDALHDVSLELHFGELVAVAGPNGAGKSTLVELLAGVLKPRSGTVLRAGSIGFVVQRPEAPAALPVTVADVVAMGTWAGNYRGRRTAARKDIEEAIGRVGLSGLQARPFTSLSGGQRQRALLAQGLVRRPEILLLDEPAAGLDAASRARTREILAEEAARGAAVACVTHDDESIETAGRVIRLDGGRLVPSHGSSTGLMPAAGCRTVSRPSYWYR